MGAYIKAVDYLLCVFSLLKNNKNSIGDFVILEGKGRVHFCLL